MAKLEVNDTIDAKLVDCSHFLGAQMLTQFHTEARGQVFLIFDVLCCVQTDAWFDQQMFFTVRFWKFQKI